MSSSKWPSPPGSTSNKLVLYSSPTECSARIRLALKLKGLSFDTINVNLDKGEHQTLEYKEVNPAATVPTLVVKGTGQWTDSGWKQGNVVITQSIPALEYIEETLDGSMALLPSIDEPEARAAVRSLVAIMATDVHPFRTFRVSEAIQKHFSGEHAERVRNTGNRDWDIYWLKKGLLVYEEAIEGISRKYSFRDQITLADVVLFPTLRTATRLGIDKTPYPNICRVFSNLMEVDCFVEEWK